MLERTKRGGRAEISFVLPAAAPEGRMSVVGDFNDWDPAAHILRPRAGGERAVKIALPAGCTFAFRYQSDDGLSYIEKDADGFDDRDSFVNT